MGENHTLHQQTNEWFSPPWLTSLFLSLHPVFGNQHLYLRTHPNSHIFYNLKSLNTQTGLVTLQILTCGAKLLIRDPIQRRNKKIKKPSLGSKFLDRETVIALY